MNLKVKRCPRCNGNRLLQYENSIECLNCNEEFEIKDFFQIDDNRLILSIREKKELIEILGIAD